MNFLTSLSQHIAIQNPSLNQPNPEYTRKDSVGWEIITEQNIHQYCPQQSLPQPLPEPTRYYMIQSDFFNHVIVQKDQQLQTLTDSEWNEISSNKSLKNVCHKNLVFSILKGIPSTVRKQFWEILVRTEETRKKFQVDYYKLLEIENPSNRTIIQKDVPRTHIESRHKDKLANILIAYSNFSSSGYTQGINIICASILSLLSYRADEDIQDFECEIDEIGFEEKVFWILVGIMETKNWKQCFDEMKGLKRMLGELRELMGKYCPRVLDHVEGLELDLNMCFSQFYLTLGTHNAPIALATTILDLFMLEGEKVIHSVILKMLITCQDKILEIQEMGELMKFFKKGILEHCNRQAMVESEKGQKLDDFLLNFFTVTTH